jgi:hypothetical protein
MDTSAKEAIHLLRQALMTKVTAKTSPSSTPTAEPDCATQLEALVLARAGGSTSEATYDPMLLTVGMAAVDELRRLQTTHEMKPVLETRFDAKDVQWMERGKIFKLNNLGRADLMQVALQCIEMLERLDAVQSNLTTLTNLWRDGEVYPLAAE